MKRAYEKYQLSLIVREYLSSGYKIISPSDWLAGSTGTFPDALLEKDGQLIFIELIHSGLTNSQLEERQLSLKRLSEMYPSAQVDFRYIDNGKIALGQAALEQWADPIGEIKKILRSKVPNHKENYHEDVSQKVKIWINYSTMLRCFHEAITGRRSDDKSILDIYNILLKKEILIPPEQMDESIKIDFFELYYLMTAVIEGAQIERRKLDEIREHYLCNRRQIRKLMKETPALSIYMF